MRRFLCGRSACKFRNGVLFITTVFLYLTIHNFVTITDYSTKRVASSQDAKASDKGDKPHIDKLLYKSLARSTSTDDQSSLVRNIIQMDASKRQADQQFQPPQLRQESSSSSSVNVNITPPAAKIRSPSRLFGFDKDGQHYKIVYYATTWFRMRKPWWGDSYDVFQGCAYKNCWATTDFKYYAQSEAAVFHASDLSAIPNGRLMKLKSLRHPDQIWIWYTLESPLHAPMPYRSDIFFNWTCTYSQRSEIVTPYGTGYYEGLEKSIRDGTNKDFSKYNFAQNKSKRSAIWIVSNCNTQSNRQNYVRQLSKVFPIDVIGRCGSGKRPYGEQLDKFVAQYKFYIGFENSLCHDYITEKPFVWALKLGLIPVVMGATLEEYTNRFPPNSFIHIDQFKSVDTLGDYMQEIVNNDELYNSYFKWRKDNWYKPNIYDTEAAMCQVCRKLHLRSYSRQSFEVTGFWNKQKQCWNPDW